MKEELKQLMHLGRIDTVTYNMIISRDTVSVDEFCSIAFTVLEHGFYNLFIELVKQHQKVIHEDNCQELVDKAFKEDWENPCKDILDIIKLIKQSK